MMLHDSYTLRIAPQKRNENRPTINRYPALRAGPYWAKGFDLNRLPVLTLTSNATGEMGEKSLWQVFWQKPSRPISA
jgi:hypothetical protein